MRELSKVNIVGKIEDFISMLHCFSFLFATKDLGFQIERNSNELKWKLYGFSDSDWGNDLDSRKIITGFEIFVNGNLLHWGSRGKYISCITSFIVCGSGIFV